MSKRRLIELSEDMSELIYLDYQTRQDVYDSFDEYMEDITEYLELKLIQKHHNDELERINEKLERLELKRLGISF